MSTKTQITQAVIAAGGKGERLRPLTNDRPKPMVEINGHPFLEYLISLLKKNGITEVILLLGYLPEKVIEYFGDGSKFGVNIRYSVNDVKLNNGTRVREAAPLLAERFIVLYGDMYWPMNLAEMLQRYDEFGKPAMLTLYDNKNGDGEYPEGNIAISRENLVTFYEDFKDIKEGVETRYLDIGFCILEKKLLPLMPEEDFEFQRGFLGILIKKKLLSAFVTTIPYTTITSPKFLKATEKFFAKRRIVI